MELSNPWTEAPSHTGLVSVGTHSLFLRVSGPPREPQKPVVIVEAGFSDCSTAWPAVERFVSSFARIYTYDRAGWGKSDSSTAPRTAEAIAAELSVLLQAAGVSGPYILVGHSYGGILVREFVNLRRKDCVGVVFVDSVIGESDLTWPFASMTAMLGSLDRFDVVGLTKSTKLTPAEWEAFMNSEKQDRFSESSKAEYGEIPQSLKILESRKQMENKVLKDCPVSVIRGYRDLDWQKYYEAGLKAGNGTAEQRDTMKIFLDGITDTYEIHQRRLLELSSNSRMVQATDSGHQVNQERPDVVADEVKWVLENLGHS
jgi:pimeloyl-ACP methyl ester carboxylesterase